MTRIVFSPAARSDLDRIDDYTIETFGFDQADKTLATFQKVLETLAAHPFSARERPELDPPGRRFRYRVVLGYLIIVYEPLEDRIRVARILDGRRGDLQAILEQEPGEGESDE